MREKVTALSAFYFFSNFNELTESQDRLKLLLPKNLFCGESARKRIVPPIECELSFPTGTFLNNYDNIDKKP